MTRTDLLERDGELAELLSAARQACRGRGRLVVVEGAAGSGKSALLAAARESASAAGLRVLAARGSELERGLAYGAIRQLFETVVSSASAADRQELLAGAAAPAAWAVTQGGQAAPAGADASFAALHGIYWLATNLAQAAPLLLVVDDLHWVDASSVRSLAYVATRIADLPIVLVVALRPDEPGTPVELLDALRSEPGAVHVRLRPLRPASAATIVRASVPDADDALCTACFTASAGNPFYLRELLRMATGNGHRIELADLVRDASIPAVGDRVIRRIARVGPEAVALAQAMAVLDDGGRLADAASLAGLDEGAAASAASRMRRFEILEREDPFAFVHPLVRRSVYDGLSVAERDAAHAAAAARLRAGGVAPEAIAAHVAAIRPRRSASVAATLLVAAREAIARAAPEAAVRWLRRALEEEAPEPPRAILLHELGSAEVLARDPLAATHLAEALELATEPRRQARVGRDLTELHFADGRWSAGVATASAALAALGDRDDDLGLELELLRAAMRAQDPRHRAAYDRDRDRLRGLATGPGWGSRALAVFLAAIQAGRGEDVPEVLAVLERERYDGRPLDGRAAGAWATTHVWALVLVEADDRALDLVDALAADAHGSGALAGALILVGYRGWLHSRRGELSAAEAEIRPGLDLSLQGASSLNAAASFWFLTDAMLERPSLDDLVGVLEAFPVEPGFAGTWGGAMLLEARGRVRLARGDRTGAIADLRANAATNRALSRAPVHSSWRSALALALPAERRDGGAGARGRGGGARGREWPGAGARDRAAGVRAAPRRPRRARAPAGVRRAARGLARPPGARALAGRARRRAAPPRAARAGARAARGRSGARPPLRRRAARRPRRRGAARGGRPPAAHRAHRRRRADRQREPRRAPGGGGALEPPGRPRALREPDDRRDPPLARVRQARPDRPRRPPAARRRARTVAGLSPGSKRQGASPRRTARRRATVSACGLER